MGFNVVTQPFIAIYMTVGTIFAVLAMVQTQAAFRCASTPKYHTADKRDTLHRYFILLPDHPALL